MSDTGFDYLVTLYRATKFTGERKGELDITNQGICDALKVCLNDLHEYSVAITEDTTAVAVGNTVHVEFGEPKLGLGMLTDDMTGLLKAQRHRLKEPKNYFLIERKFAKGDADPPAEVQQYRRLLQLVELLETVAAYLDRDAGKLVFVHGGRFEMPIAYTVKDLAIMDEAATSKLLAFVGDDAFNEKKLGILEGAIRETCQPYAEPDRFSGLLANLPELAEKATHGYRVFISEFSYDKIRDALETAKVEYAAKIHKVFTDIQTQILTIPVATIVVATQMKSATTYGYEFWVNTAVLAGVWVFAILVSFLLVNQRFTLAVIDGEIKRQKEHTKKNYEAIAEQFAGVFDFLLKRLWWQRVALVAVAVVLATGLVLAHVVYFRLTNPEQDSHLATAKADVTQKAGRGVATNASGVTAGSSSVSPKAGAATSTSSAANARSASAAKVAHSQASSAAGK
ncbi:hypothetical protein [Paraburkholderia metrosideri]|uniref:Phage-related membrane protein n=1 Tax=Paraburkholderia metrosideri TaxID=580937 RepID=A0ABN7HYC0_9BURK|nr:hypothetical protein [Paraburkholderia metrosideri]CAD6539224.1 hypothetical protein LMG28140_03348 [Paraburkholderia metrosideri]